MCMGCFYISQHIKLNIPLCSNPTNLDKHVSEALIKYQVSDTLPVASL